MTLVPSLRAPLRHLRPFVLAACALAAGAVLAVAPEASACGVDDATFERPVVQPVVSGSSASSLFAQAANLDARASALDGRAMSMERRADSHAAEARALRLEAIQSEGTNERVRLLDLADTLASAAITERAEARRIREEASVLRTQARVTRQRANQLVNVRPPHWRERPVDWRRPTVSAPRPVRDTNI